jgi:hypothetical protein
MKKSELKQIIKEEIQKILNEDKLQKGDKIHVNAKLGNMFSRAIDVNPLEWPNENETYEVVGVDKSMYGLKGKYGSETDTTLWHDKKWIESEIGKKIEIL